eukprot:4199436-Pyramimonas_sp.AAC.1
MPEISRLQNLLAVFPAPRRRTLAHEEIRLQILLYNMLKASPHQSPLVHVAKSEAHIVHLVDYRPCSEGPHLYPVKNVALAWSAEEENVTTGAAPSQDGLVVLANPLRNPMFNKAVGGGEVGVERHDHHPHSTPLAIEYLEQL